MALAGLQAPATVGAQPAPFTLPQVLSYPYPLNLVAAPSGSAIAWVFDEKGVRNIWMAAGPDFRPRRLTAYTKDDGQELTNLAFTGDGQYLVYVRGGDHDSNWPAAGNLMPDPDHNPVQPLMEVWAVPTAGGHPTLIGEGDEPAIAPHSHRLVFLRNHEIWAASIDGGGKPHRLFFARGNSRSPAWSPDGRTLAFVSDRGDHAFIGLYTGDDRPLRYLAPSTSRDLSPRWSPDGRHIAFARLAGEGGAAEDPLEQHPQPWSIWVGEVGTLAARRVWQSPDTLDGSFPRTAGNANLHWAAGDRLVFLSDADGWPHLYSVAVSGGEATRLTTGGFMVEYVAMTPDRREIVYNANTGTDRDDIDRRHLFKVAVTGGAPATLTSGTGLEFMPVVTADGRTVAFLSATAQRPLLPAVEPIDGGAPRLLAEDRIPADFPTSRLVTPTSVIVKSPDGLDIHCQLFETAAGAEKRPAVIFVHGGPPRQMLLGWHYMDYYTNSYAVNQYLASRGYIVLSVNYRLGIGYGHAFHHPDHAGMRGASEYQDVLAAGKYLQTRPDVDPQRIGIWGGSYGGYLTALALARNSDVFHAGVDMHGVHNWLWQTAADSVDPDPIQAAVGDGITRAQYQHVLDVIWQSSPDSSMATWKSPVLLIQGDDDRNVKFHQTVDLAQRLKAAGVPFDELVLPDEIHGFLRWASWVKADEATAAYFDRIFQVKSPL
ncbi:MAG: S9 family peptidase [Acidobacteriota bacterium]|nr:S9 family peptidase [Acidobacteriota bacterium]